MIHACGTIESPVTGERLVFHKSARQTDGHVPSYERTGEAFPANA